MVKVMSSRGPRAVVIGPAPVPVAGSRSNSARQTPLGPWLTSKPALGGERRVKGRTVVVAEAVTEPVTVTSSERVSEPTTVPVKAADTVAETSAVAPKPAVRELETVNVALVLTLKVKVRSPVAPLAVPEKVPEAVKLPVIGSVTAPVTV